MYVGSAPIVSSYLERYAKMDYAPPFFDGLVGTWGRTFGFDEASLAAFAAVIAALALLAVGWAAGEIAGPVAALFAMLLAADSDILFWEFDQVRPYAFSVGCAAVVLALFARRWKMRDGPARPGLSVAFGASTLLLGLSHYAGSLAVAVMGVALLAGIVGRRHRSFWRSTLLSCAVSGAVLLPWLPAMRRQMSIGLPWNEHPSWSGRIGNAAALAWNLLPRWGSHGPALSAVPFAMAAIVGIVVLRDARRQFARMGVPIGLAIVWALAVLIVFGLTWGVSRYVSISAAMTAIVLACLLVAIGRALRGKGARAGWLVAAGVFLAIGPVLGEALRFAESGVSRRQPVRTGVRTMLAGLRLRPTDLVVAAPSYLAPTLWYYGVRGRQLRGFPQWENPEEIDYSRFSEIWKKPGAADECAGRIFRRVAEGGVERIILVTDLNPTLEVRGATERIRRDLASRFPLVAEGTFHGYPETIRATVFAVRPGSR